MSMDNVPPGYVERPTLEDYLKPYEEETARLREQLKVAVGALEELEEHARWGGDIEAYQRWVNGTAGKALIQIKDLEK